MNILLTGRLASVSYSFTDEPEKHYNVIVSSDDACESYIGRKGKLYKHSPFDDEFSHIFNVHSIDTVIYFFDEPTVLSPDFSALERLDRVLACCCRYNVSRVVFIASSYAYSGDYACEQAEYAKEDNQQVLLYSAHSLCKSYRKNKKLDILTLNVPVCYGCGENKSLIGKAIFRVMSKGFVNFEGQRGQSFDLLSLEDLGVLVSRILGEWPDNVDTIAVPGSETISFLQLGELFRQITHITRISYSDSKANVAPHCNSDTARNMYDWTPTHKMSDELFTLTDRICDDEEEQPKLWQRIKKLVTSKSFIIISVELALCYLVMEYFNIISSTAVQFKYIDYRLMFVIFISAAHGMKAGIAAALLACLSCAEGYAALGIDGTVSISGVELLLPFACYIFAAAVLGRIKDIKEKRIADLTEERDTLSKRYSFLYELYDNALNNKDRYKRQIISYRNSFGRIFRVTRRLNSMLPDEVFREALLALEELLDNKTIAIYNVSGNTGFARLCVCSKKIIATAEKSLRMDKYKRAVDSFCKDEVWINSDRIAGYPDYIFPVYRNDELFSVIIINKVSFDQMAMYYENLIKILCSLIEDSLVRTLSYADKVSGEIYIENSSVMRKDAFLALVNVRAEMEKEAIAEYSMLKIPTQPENIVQISDKLKGFFRSNDVFGQGEDGNLYVILMGTGGAAIKTVIKRLSSSGIESEVV